MTFEPGQRSIIPLYLATPRLAATSKATRIRSLKSTHNATTAKAATASSQGLKPPRRVPQ